MRSKSGVDGYYSRRADEYESVYDKPERQSELSELRELIRQFAAGGHVLDVACGTGYWTSVVAAAAEYVHGVDISFETLRIAKAKEYPKHNVTFTRGDVHSASYRCGAFSAAIAGFFLSHIPRDEVVRFVENLVTNVGVGSRFLLFDNLYVPGSSTAISRQDSAGNTYQTRKLMDGSQFQIMKNFFNATELRDLGACVGRDVSVEIRKFYWILEFVGTGDGGLSGRNGNN